MTQQPTFSGATNIDSILIKIAQNPEISPLISDIHLSTDDVIALRLNGEIHKQENGRSLSQEDMEIIMKQLLKGNQKSFEKFLSDRDADFSYVGADGTPYRVNAFFKLGKMAVVMRKINATAMQLENIMLPEHATMIKDLILTKKKGLYLVTGPTGSGKSTSLVAMIEYLNQTRKEHIVTIEDPIEFIFTPQHSIISQRAIGHDTWSFKNALRGVVREDPDIVLVGEIRDRETAESVLNLAETGHLVFSTLHTSSAAQTISRMISFFSPDIQESIADRLGDSLLGVQSQMLQARSDKKGRIGLFEIMVNTPAVKNNIKKKQIAQIDNIIETGIKYGMITMKQYATKLVEQGKINPQTMKWLFTENY